MRILLDACVTKRFLDQLVGFDVVHARELEWHELSNGKLLSVAQDVFDVLITVDKGIPFQNNLSKFKIAVIVLRVEDNTFESLKALADGCRAAIRETTVGKVIFVDSPE